VSRGIGFVAEWITFWPSGSASPFPSARAPAASTLNRRRGGFRPIGSPGERHGAVPDPKAPGARHPVRFYCAPAGRESHLTIHSWMKRSLPLVRTMSIILSSSLWRMNASPTPLPSIK